MYIGEDAIKLQNYKEMERELVKALQENDELKLLVDELTDRIKELEHNYKVVANYNLDLLDELGERQ